VAGIATLGPLLAAITPTLLNFLFGIVAGAVVLAGVLLVKRLLPKKKKTG
ncbi:photosystem II reaction center protein PsbX, partial [Pseudomonas aeruginosa]